ncbi:glycoside hydrolase family protein [Paracoccus alkanivorans]|uniref:glycoside hydrolase family protein n=1 Tax=Paracoccus alkanivorans TaxID=2116655 RepID=UPI003C79CCBB
MGNETAVGDKDRPTRPVAARSVCDPVGELDGFGNLPNEIEHGLPRWNRAGGKVVQGLVNRRTAEQRLCLSALDGE